MSKTVYCRPHAAETRQLLHADSELGCGNFLFKVLEQTIDRTGVLFALEQPWQSPSGAIYPSLTVPQLHGAVADLASWYWSCGVREGHVVCTYTSEGVSQFLHALALISLRAVPAPVNWRMKPDIALLYHRKYKFDFFVHDQHDHVAALRTLDAGNVKFLDAGVLHTYGPISADPMAPPWPAQFGAVDETLMICHSSGTTGVPKAVLFGHQQFFVGKRSRLLHFLQDDGDRMLCALPHSHSAGFSYLMTAVLLGMPTRILSQLTGPSVVDNMVQFTPTVLAAFSQTYAALADAVLQEGSLSSLRRSYNTGDTAHETHVRALLSAAPNASFYDGFGASELGMALFTKVSSLKEGVASGRCVGLPVPFATARILDNQGQPLPVGQIGYIALRSDSITPGYYQDPSLTQRCRTKDGYWLTGDVGYLDSAGAFYHLDRAVDVIGTPRGAVYSLALEEEMMRHAPVADLTITGVPLAPKVTQMVTAIICVPPAEAEVRCQAVLSQLDQLLGRSLGGSVPICVANWSIDRPSLTGATGKALKRLIRDDFWSLYQTYKSGDTAALTHAAFCHL